MTDPVQRLYDAAREALAEGDARAANARLKEMQAAAPEDFRTIEIEGDIAMDAGNDKKARAAYRRL